MSLLDPSPSEQQAVRLLVAGRAGYQAQVDHTTTGHVDQLVDLLEEART